ncbi:prephenate dehydrogenase/arogenate dehydrogenase family protein [Candidatus Pseudothioglobus singularis]|nr:prephenate dehydrogenase/arogenate dehydrogenase family protein [Candidatus Pseudothioglobus singularis]MDB4822783.1 prephenate dehydrogenase/arogenate dehydrogenase family protein [Candidatus Pseudothioglobus singularis]
MLNKITIIGVGLIGGSLAKAIKATKLANIVCGYGRDQSRLEKAKKGNIIDELSTDMAEAIKDADIVVIATPVGTFNQILKEIEPFISDQVIITDVGSTKTNIIKIVNEVLAKKSKYFVPAHPIAGKEKSGFEVSVPDLFKDKKVIITPLENNAPESTKIIHDMWSAVGADVDFMSPESHDELLGMTSHLPHMLAFSLVNYLVSQNPTASIYAGGGFKDFSRIASGDAVMWRDICLQNKDQITEHINGYQATLSELKDAINSDNSEKLELLFTTAKNTRDSWVG